MRKLLRNIARHKMKRAGIQHPNKKLGGTGRGDSFFAMHWREFV